LKGLVSALHVPDPTLGVCLALAQSYLYVSSLENSSSSNCYFWFVLSCISIQHKIPWAHTLNVVLIM